MKNSICSYESPVLSLMTVLVEKGFADSVGDGSDPYLGLPGYGIEEVENW